MNARPKFYLDLADAACIAHAPFERDPEIDEARAIEERETARREDDSYGGATNAEFHWE